MKEKLFIFDTTLRDGAQTYGVDFNVDEKKILASTLLIALGFTKSDIANEFYDNEKYT